MKIFVKAKPGARQTRVEKISDNTFAVSVIARAEAGRANTAIVEALAEYFGVPKSTVQIVSGHASRQKLVEIK